MKCLLVTLLTVPFSCSVSPPPPPPPPPPQPLTHVSLPLPDRSAHNNNGQHERKINGALLRETRVILYATVPASSVVRPSPSVQQDGPRRDRVLHELDVCRQTVEARHLLHQRQKLLRPQDHGAQHLHPPAARRSDHVVPQAHRPRHLQDAPAQVSAGHPAVPAQPRLVRVQLSGHGVQVGALHCHGRPRREHCPVRTLQHLHRQGQDRGAAERKQTPRRDLNLERQVSPQAPDGVLPAASVRALHPHRVLLLGRLLDHQEGRAWQSMSRCDYGAVHDHPRLWGALGLARCLLRHRPGLLRHSVLCLRVRGGAGVCLHQLHGAGSQQATQEAGRPQAPDTRAHHGGREGCHDDGDDDGAGGRRHGHRRLAQRHPARAALRRALERSTHRGRRGGRGGNAGHRDHAEGGAEATPGAGARDPHRHEGEGGGAGGQEGGTGHQEGGGEQEGGGGEVKERRCVPGAAGGRGGQWQWRDGRQCGERGDRPNVGQCQGGASPLWERQWQCHQQRQSL
ncbi:uncharacterized protein LOC135103331 isoform X1 [Scylla paramamosain]|uniref:uncharacterized protein LOC135103331 isoform X1 n=1 Tax=Scylla paramamosain TaxID=85552 RepID=UPI0030832488